MNVSSKSLVSVASGLALAALLGLSSTACAQFRLPPGPPVPPQFPQTAPQGAPVNIYSVALYARNPVTGVVTYQGQYYVSRYLNGMVADDGGLTQAASQLVVDGYTPVLRSAFFRRG